jgi:hypothetical protein
MGMDLKHVTRRVKLIEMLSWESLFIPSRLSTHRSTKSSAREKPTGEKRREGETTADSNLLEPQVVRPQHHQGDDDLE